MVSPRVELIDLGWVAIDDPAGDVSHVGERIDIVFVQNIAESHGHAAPHRRWCVTFACGVSCGSTIAIRE